MLSQTEQLIGDSCDIELASRPCRVQTIVIDDSPEVLNVICALLDRNDEIDLVARGEDGIDAIELVAKLRPDLVLMDVNMPRLNGLQAAGIISSRFPDTQVVLMSANDAPSPRDAALACGAAGFVSKARFQDELSVVLEGLVTR